MKVPTSRDFFILFTVWMKDYYSILKVRQTASAGEIKRSYRVLVQQFHPDVNPDPTAHELIKEINEAYDVLGDEIKRREYDIRLANPFVTEETPQPPPHRDPYFRRKGRSAPSHNSEKSERLQLIEKSLPFFQWVFRIGAVFCFVLLIDFLVPRSVATEKIVEIYEVRTRGRYGGSYHYTDALVTNTGRIFIVDVDETKYFRVDPVIQVYESRILSLTTKIQTKSKSYVLTDFDTVYNNFSFLPIIVAIGSVIGLVVKKGTLDFHFSLGLVILVLLIITIKLML